MSPTKAGQQIFHTRLSKTALKSIFYYSVEKFKIYIYIYIKNNLKLFLIKLKTLQIKPFPLSEEK